MSRPATSDMKEKITCNGFQAAGIEAGIKKNGRKDLGLICAEKPAVVAGVFTTNRVQAAPVLLDKQRITSKRCQAIVVNSGNANCCTGAQGLEDAAAMADSVADALGIAPELVMVASTGVIGEPLPVDKIQTAAPQLVRALRPDGFSDLAEAIMTTDTVPKLLSTGGQVDGRSYTITAVAKGAGMIRPDMATMLGFVCSDIDISADMLQRALRSAAANSFNRITIDGDTSTNDTVLLMASGLSGARVRTEAHYDSFRQTLEDLFIRLARMIVKDGEGVTKLVDIVVKGARNDEDARRIADTVSHSNLVKTAFYGEDANWGRIIAAAGRAGVALDPDTIDIFFNDVQMVKNGIGCGKKIEAKATAVLQKPEFTVTVDLHQGPGQAAVITCDFSIDYVKINADYRT